MSRYVIGVDVGTGSARAGLFDLQGSLLASAVEPIQTWRPKPDFVEQSSENIWRAVGKTVRETLKMAQISAEQVVGVSFDATCSLVVLDANNEPLPVNDEGDSNRNIIVWMDHRAIEESEEINAGGYEVLKYVGGRLSPEMETPKLKWLKKNLPETWAKAGKYLDLADFLTYRSTGVDSRSLCTVVCKWTYLGHEGGVGIETTSRRSGLTTFLRMSASRRVFCRWGVISVTSPPPLPQNWGLPQVVLWVLGL